MNNPQLTEEALERALIRCLRLFAQHGRKLRSQASNDDKRALDKAASAKASNASGDNDGGKSELTSNNGVR